MTRRDLSMYIGSAGAGLFGGALSAYLKFWGGAGVAMVVWATLSLLSERRAA